MAERKPFANLYEALKKGDISRRQFLQRATAMGMSAAVAGFVVNSLDMKGASAQSATPEASGGSSMVGTTPDGGFEGVTRGQGGELKLLLWQAPTVLNPHTSTGTKDYLAASLAVEPLLNYTPDSTITTRLVTEVPTLENGGLAEDLSSVTYKLLPDVVWSDGEPFTAKDVKFTFDWISVPENAAVSANLYANVDSVEVIDDLTAKVNFKIPALAWYIPFSGTFGGSIIPGHHWNWDVTATEPTQSYRSAPIGTGPYVVNSFSENDQVTYVANELFREANKPFFATVNIKGGGDAPSAARAVLQTADYDWAWNLQVEPEVLAEMVAEGKGYLVATAGINTESIYIQHADPNVEVDGQRSEMSTVHPALGDLAVRQALSYAIDRDTIANEFYGNDQVAAWNYLVGIPAYTTMNLPYSYDPAKANEILDAAGWVLDGSTRKKGDVELKWKYQTSINTVRQKTQAVVKGNLAEVGIEVELASVDAGIYFDSAAGNDQNISHFYADLEMYTTGPTSPFPQDYMVSFYSGDDNVAQKSNDWSGNNYSRFINADFDAAYEAATSTTDAELAAAKFVEMNDILTDQAAVVPLVARAASVGAGANALLVDNIALGPFEGDFWNIINWIKTE
jgi:peptide/nickel transport system substrate-binding protein